MIVNSLRVFLLAMLLFAISSCGGGLGTPEPGPLLPPTGNDPNPPAPDPTTDGMAVHINIPEQLTGAAEATWSAEISGGVAPFTVEWYFNDGAEPDWFLQREQGRLALVSTTMVNDSFVRDADYGYQVLVTGADGAGVTAFGGYTVAPPVL